MIFLIFKGEQDEFFILDFSKYREIRNCDFLSYLEQYWFNNKV